MAIARRALCVSQKIQAPISTWTLWIQDIILALTHRYVLLFLPLVPPKGNTENKRYVADEKKGAKVPSFPISLNLKALWTDWGKTRRNCSPSVGEIVALNVDVRWRLYLFFLLHKPYTSSICRSKTHDKSTSLSLDQKIEMSTKQ